jgi:pyridoxine 5-phosphate synthase
MKLNVNIDHFATLRNARGYHFPDPVKAADIAEAAGASGIVCHLREDRRHIKDDDVKRLKESVKGQFDFEISLDPEILDIAIATRPDLVTLVPEKREELTTEGGMNMQTTAEKLKSIIPRFHEAGIRVSLFVEPDEYAIRQATELKADMVELHTGHYSDHHIKNGWDSKCEYMVGGFKSAAKLAKSLGLEVAAGHGITLDNISPISAIKDIDELSIGHALVADSLFLGLENAVIAYLEKMK